MLKVSIVAAGLLLSVQASFACGTFTLENRPPGERTATIEDDRVLTIREAGETEVYDLVSAGSGLPYMIGERQGGGEGVEVLEHAGDLIVDMMVYVPFCEGR